jgi:phenylpropionate dioxygenase-like ring-hydroxylating dioxygenase large terminal subunit
MNHTDQLIRFSRSDMTTVAEVYASDQGEVPWPLLEQSPPPADTRPIATHVYWSREVHDREVERLWSRTWQWACRLEEIPNVGDTIVFDIADLSAIVIRTEAGNGPGAIKAFRNACRHRGTKLRIADGNAPMLRCPYHAWTWNLDGSFQSMPCEWDFEHLDTSTLGLRELPVETWKGFVMINFDTEATSFREHLGPVAEHFESFPLEDWAISVHIDKVMPSNWKITMEAFLEAYHTVMTHPGLLEYTGDANSQNDVYELHSRLTTLMAVASPHLGGDAYDQVEVLRAMQSMRNKGNEIVLPPGTTARRQAVENMRAGLQRSYGVDLSGVSDAMLMDSVQYLVFPNFCPWATYATPLVYRFRPNGNDPETCIMTLMLLRPFAGDRPAPASKTTLDIDQSWGEAPGMKSLGVVYDQDAANVRRVQAGIKTSGQDTVELGAYQESRIRHFHGILHQYLNGER